LRIASFKSILPPKNHLKQKNPDSIVLPQAIALPHLDTEEVVARLPDVRETHVNGIGHYQNEWNDPDQRNYQNARLKLAMGIYKIFFFRAICAYPHWHMVLGNGGNTVRPMANHHVPVDGYCHQSQGRDKNGSALEEGKTSAHPEASEKAEKDHFYELEMRKGKKQTASNGPRRCRLVSTLNILYRP
jgi:hypothetical protein